MLAILDKLTYEMVVIERNEIEQITRFNYMGYNTRL
jgi:hypothetical protein